jgi:hypothetical protein
MNLPTRGGSAFRTYRVCLRDIQDLPSGHTGSAFRTYRVCLPDIQSLPSGHTGSAFRTYRVCLRDIQGLCLQRVTSYCDVHPSHYFLSTNGRVSTSNDLLGPHLEKHRLCCAEWHDEVRMMRRKPKDGAQKELWYTHTPGICLEELRDGRKPSKSGRDRRCYYEQEAGLISLRPENTCGSGICKQ